MARKKRKGYTLLEVAISFACIGIMMAGVFAAASFVSKTKGETDSSIVMNTFVISAIETIQGDIADGIDVLSVDYNQDSRIFSSSLQTEIVIYSQDDVYGKPLYQVKIDMTNKLIGNRNVVRVLLRGER